MIIKNIFKGATALLLSASMVACSSDYLDVPPVTSLDSSTITSSIEGAKTGYYGVCAAMYCQYTAYANYYSFNGESWFSSYYGDVTGSDYFSWIWAGRTNTFALNWTSMNNDQSWIPLMGWFYSYTLISGANNILVGIDKLDESADRDFIKAGCLTLRAHAYFRLLQLYAPRWEDSNGGETKCIVLRTTPTVGDSPLVTMNEVLDQIYEDLDNAIALYEKWPSARRTYSWEPDLSIARGVYARTAMLKHDYGKAQDMASKARVGYPIMSAEEYKGGFAEANGEWMWNNDSAPEDIYYYAWGSWYTCNGPYPTVWGYGPGAINYDLYKQMDPKDIRRSLFWTPDKKLYPGLSASDFWNNQVVDPISMNMNGKSNYMIQSIALMNRECVPNDDVAKWGLPNQVSTEADAVGAVTVPFGAQYKFWCLDEYGSTSFPYMRGAEMLLTEAEAAWHNSDVTTAQNCLTELNSKRVEGYTCASSGDALLDEIKLSRRLELWGEGHSWFDLKRWNVPMSRRAWVAGDINSNNIPTTYAITVQPDAYHGWRYAIPRYEIQYNQAIRPSELGY